MKTTSRPPTAMRRLPRPTPIAHLPGPAIQITAGPAALFVLWSRPTGQVAFVSRVSLTTHRVTATSGPLVGAVHVVADDGAVWVSEHASSSLPRAGAVLRLDRTRLVVTGRLSLPQEAGPLGASDAGLWAASGHDLVLIDPETLAVKRTVPTGPPVSLLTVSRVTNVLYDVTGTAGRVDVRRVQERDGFTGRLRASTRSLDDMVSVNSLVGVADGVWTAYSSGLQGGAQLLSWAGLRALTHPRDGFDAGTNGVHVSVAAGLLWFDSGGGAVSCGSERTGRLTAVLRTRGFQQYTGLVWAHDTMYGATGRQVMTISGTERCRGG